MELNIARLDSINEAFVSISNSKICGKYLMKLQKPISWTWYSSNMESVCGSNCVVSCRSDGKTCTIHDIMYRDGDILDGADDLL